MLFSPQDVIIPQAKLTQYLLIPLPKDDKSKFLAQAGYSLDNWQQLEQDLRTQVLIHPAEFMEATRYGDKYLIRSSLRGINGIDLNILTVWIVSNQVAQFVTLVPDKGANS